MPLQPLTTTTQSNFLVLRTKQTTSTNQTKKWPVAVLPHLQEFGVAADDVHYNAAGCDFLAKKVTIALEEALKQKK